MSLHFYSLTLTLCVVKTVGDELKSCWSSSDVVSGLDAVTEKIWKACCTRNLKLIQQPIARL